MRNKFLMFSLSFFLLGCQSHISSVSSQAEGSSHLGELHHIMVETNSHCSVELNKTEARVNEEIVVTISDIEFGYCLDSIKANGNKIDNNKFYMPNEDVVISVSMVQTFESFSVNIESSPYAKITVDNSKYKAGDLVNIDYQTRGTYILDSFYVNNEKISGTNFYMPNENVVLRGEFVDSIEDTENQLIVYGGGVISRSFWYFKYGEDGLNVKIKVMDRILCGASIRNDPGYRDNIEFIISQESNAQGWDTYTYKILISCDGGFYFQRANNASSWGTPFIPVDDIFNFDVNVRSLNDKQGYDGYEVNVFIGYDLFGADISELINHLTICMAQRNTTNYNASGWVTYTEQGCLWENVSTHPIILENGNLKERN